MSENNSPLLDPTTSQEEVFGPPRIDIVGMSMMILVSIVVGFLSSIGVLILAFLSFGSFSLGSGISPILLAMITFFALTISNMIYIWSARGIFPHMYSATRTVFLYISVFSIILYIAIAPLYLIVGSSIMDGSGVLIAYIAHILLNMFGLEIISNTLSGYRYSLLSLYSSIVSLILTGTLLFFIYQNTASSISGNVLFILLGLSMLAFFIGTITTFLIRFCYYRWYILSGSDPIGAVFSQIESEARANEKEAEKRLFEKK